MPSVVDGDQRVKIPVVLLFGFLGWLRVMAQVDLRVTLPQELYLPGESIEAAVRIANFTGRKVALGKVPGWLRFNVEAQENFVVNRVSEIPDSGEFTLDSSTRGTIRFDIQPHFELTRPGRYRLTATVKVSAEEEFTSPPVVFEVIRGTKLWEREFGVPEVAGETAPRRKYVLNQVTHMHELRLYIRVTDADENATLKTVPLGNLVSFGRPACSVDRQSRLHVLQQYDSENYRYHRIDPDGTLVERRTYQFGDRRPELRMNEGGEVAVVGGERRRTANDLPVPAVKTAPNQPDEAAHHKPKP